MTMNLYWEPLDREKKSLPDALKHALRKRYGGTVNEILSEHDVAYLEGLRDAGIDGADDLIEAIETHGRISVTEHS